MSQFQSVIINKGSGKLGDVVISKWRAKKVVRSYVQHVNGKTDAARANQAPYRLKVKVWSKSVATMRGTTNLIWSIRLKQKTEFSAMMQFLLKSSDGTPLLLTTKLAGAQIGAGKLPPTLPLTLVAAAGRNLTITWDNVNFPPAFPSTTATLVVLFIATNGIKISIRETATLFSTGTATVPFLDQIVGQAGYVMIGFKNTYTNALTLNTYVWRSKFTGLSVAAFQTLIA